MAENSTTLQRKSGPGRPFPKGQSGNPSGKPKGARNKTTLAAEALLDGEAKALTRLAIDKAKGGDMVALRLCLERIIPARKSRHIAFDVPQIKTASDTAAAFNALVTAMGRGRLAPDEALAVASVLDMKRKAVETVEIERRLAALEQERESKRG